MTRVSLLTALSLSSFLTAAYAQVPVYAQASASVASPASAPSSSDLTPIETTKPSALEVENPVDPASLLPDLKPLSPQKATLLGGTVTKLDRVQDRVAVQVFGGGKVKVFFDPRTRIYSNGQPATIADLRAGDRIYIDTVLDGDRVFARNINLKQATAVGQSQGVVVSYRAGELEVRDQLSPKPLRVQIGSSTRIVRGDRAVSASELVPGTLVALNFGSQKKGGTAQEIFILATPGSSFTFAGEVVGLDLSSARLVVNSVTDHKTYEIYIDPSAINVADELHLGSEVSVVTNFDGSRYVARNLTIMK